MEDDDFDQLLTADDGGHLVPLPVETVTPSPLSRPVGETNVIEPQHAIIDGNLGARLNGASEDMDASTAILSIAPLPQWGSDITALQPSQERKRHARSVSSSTVSSILSLPDSPKSTLDPPVGESSKSAVGHLPAKRARTVKSYAYDAMDDDELDFEAGKKKSKGSKKKVDRESKGTPRKDRESNNPSTSRASFLTDEKLRQMLLGQTREVQSGTCYRARYAKWGKCVYCIAKQGGDTCRFIQFRIFDINPETADILGPGRFESSDWQEELTPLPTTFNTVLTAAHVLRAERTAAPMLLPLITRELRHLVHRKAVKRGLDTAKHRSVCDFCSSTIFAGLFMCQKCGRDYCLNCEQHFADSAKTILISPATTTDPMKRNAPAYHFRPDLIPVSRFSEEELKQHWLDLANFLLEQHDDLSSKLSRFGLGVNNPLTEAIREASASKDANGHDPALSAQEIDSLYTTQTNVAASPIPDPAGLEQHARPFLRSDVGKLDNERFELLWARGEPLCVDGVGGQLPMSWNPDDLIERFGSEVCHVIDCQTGEIQEITVASFFTHFKSQSDREARVWKLKDWPATSDFQTTHPELYDDFCQALPAPDYTRQDGVLNMYSRFPPGPTRPDIGPKMYHAFVGSEDVGGCGSTSLHMDVADAINLMLYANPRPDGQPGCAVWDVFRAEDADKIRAFLSKKFDSQYSFTDPIHSQIFYLDSTTRRELWEQKGVISWRIYQYPGQALFIPAGCAHQVCDLADCIKIALDFISPHNVSRCQQLTQDFRNENAVSAWKDDVLQLYNVLWFAWLSSREARARWDQTSIDDNARPAYSTLSSVRDEPSSTPKSQPDETPLAERLLDWMLSSPDDALPPSGLAPWSATIWPRRHFTGIKKPATTRKKPSKAKEVEDEAATDPSHTTEPGPSPNGGEAKMEDGTAVHPE